MVCSTAIQAQGCGFALQSFSEFDINREIFGEEHVQQN